MVAGPVDRPGLDDHDRRPAGDALLCDDVSEMLRLVVRRDVVAARPLVRLVDDATVRVSEHVHGRDVDDAQHARVDRRVEDARGAADVRLEHRRPLGLRDADLVDGRKVEHGVGSADLAGQPRPVREVALHEVGVQAGRPGRVADEGDDLVPAVAEPPQEPPAEEAGRPCHERPHAGSLERVGTG